MGIAARQLLILLGKTETEVLVISELNTAEHSLSVSHHQVMHCQT